MYLDSMQSLTAKYNRLIDPRVSPFLDPLSTFPNTIIFFYILVPITFFAGQNCRITFLRPPAPKITFPRTPLIKQESKDNNKLICLFSSKFFPNRKHTQT